MLEDFLKTCKCIQDCSDNFRISRDGTERRLSLGYDRTSGEDNFSEYLYFFLETRKDSCGLEQEVNKWVATLFPIVDPLAAMIIHKFSTEQRFFIDALLLVKREYAESAKQLLERVGLY